MSMDNQKISLNIFTISLIAIGISFAFRTLLVSPIDKIFGQSTSSTVKISKDLTNSYTIPSGASKIGICDTKYTILGNIDALKKEQKLVISTITIDFDNSPVVGYIKTSLANNQQQQSPTLANPFADKATINQKIDTELSIAFTFVSTLNTAAASIECNFGMSIAQWTCKSHGFVV
jgi:hypothetical protein